MKNLRLRNYVRDTILSCIILIVPISIIIIYNIYYFNEYFQVTTIQEYIIILYFFIMSYLLIKYKKYSCFGIIIALGMIIYIFNIIIFSPIDEAAHFDYINYIIENKSLPLINDKGTININTLLKVSNINIPGHLNHEYVHPPIYYLLMALVGQFIPNVAIRFYILRSIGLLFLVGTISYIIKSYNLLSIELKWIKRNDQLITSVAILLAFTPGIVIRFLTLSNEGLNILLGTMTTYYLMILLLKDFRKKYYYISLILIILNILTKNTSAYMFGGLILILIYFKRYKYIIAFCIALILGLLPWLSFNYINYGQLTGIQEHLKIVLPMVNPANTPLKIDYFIGSLLVFYTEYFMPQEVRIPEIYAPFLGFFGVIINITLILQFIKGATFTIKKLIGKLQFSYTFNEKQEVLNLLLVGLIILNIAVLITGSISSRVGVMIPRYVMISVLPLVLLMYKYLIDQTSSMKKIFIILICLVVSITHTTTSITFLRQKRNTLALLSTKKTEIDLNQCLKYMTSYDCKAYNNDNNELIIEAGNMDPQVINLIDRSLYNNLKAIEINYISNIGGEIQLFFRTAENNYSEENSYKYLVNPLEERNLIVQLPNHIEEIRLDVPNESQFIIKNIKVIQ